MVGPFERASVRTTPPASARLAPSDGNWWALIIESAGGDDDQRRVATNRVVAVDNGALAVNRDAVFAVALRGDNAGVAANTLSGGGNEPACRVRVTGDVVADANQCRHEAAEDPTAMLLQGSSIIASSNRLRGGKATLVLRTAENRFAAVGNLAPAGRTSTTSAPGCRAHGSR